jgi:hypothetical protein
VRPLEKEAWAQMLPLPAGPVPSLTLIIDSAAEVELNFELRTASRPDHHTPDVVLGSLKQKIPAGKNIPVTLDFAVKLSAPACVYFIVQPHASSSVVGLHGSRQMLTGVLAVRNHTRETSSAIGGEDFPVFSPLRRPKDQNLAFTLGAPLEVFAPENVTNGFIRPLNQPNAWVADPKDSAPALTLEWNEPRTLSRIDLFFDADYDHQMESVLMGHPENTSPYCAKRWRLRDEHGKILHESAENHLAQNSVSLNPVVTTRKLVLEILEMNGPVPATVMEVRCY